MRLFRLMGLSFFVVSLLLFSGIPSYALIVEVISDPALLVYEESLYKVFLSELGEENEALYDVDLPSGQVTEDRTFVLDSETGEIQFGDGLNGRIPPSGPNVAAAYRYGSGSEGDLLEPVGISPNNLPVLIIIDDPLTSVVETEISFFLLGIRSLEFEVTESGVWVNEIASIPEPTTLLLLGIGLIGLAGFRRKFRK